jgi:NAD(P)-dependent dehydrogenase (short-subunit alcohol dehydrogenase family)
LKPVAKRIVALDVTSYESIQHLATQLLLNVPIDVLINNAGVYHKSELNPDDVLDEFKTNALGPLLLSYALLPNLRLTATPHIINMTSRMGSIADNTSGGSYGYRASKSALNQMTKSWSIDQPDVPAIVVHPGYIQTGMTSFHGDMDPEECARRIMVNIVEEFLKSDGKWKSGMFLHRDGTELPW